MEPKFSLLHSCVILIFLLNPFLLFSHAHNPHHQPGTKSSAMAFLKPLMGAQKGNTSEGLSQLKKYLSNLGYIDNNNVNSRAHEKDDHFDDNLELAIKKYQKFVKIKANGLLDANTIAKLNMPRCGVPDFANGKRIQSLNISSKYTFFPGQPKWPPTKRTLTYSILNIRTDLHHAITKAINIWSSMSPFQFVYITDYDHADIKISFQYRDHGDRASFDGPGGILAHAFAPSDGRLHFDAEERWVDGIVKNSFDIQTVGLHEMGHILGLGHSADQGAIMWPYTNIGSRKGLGQDDIDGLNALYGF